MFTQDVITPSYKANTCYFDEADNRIVKVTKVLNYNYYYVSWLDGHWSNELIQSARTIEIVYRRKINCP
jgi:hypothetical protein